MQVKWNYGFVCASFVCAYVRVCVCVCMCVCACVCVQGGYVYVHIHNLHACVYVCNVKSIHVICMFIN